MRCIFNSWSCEDVAARAPFKRPSRGRSRGASEVNELRLFYHENTLETFFAIIQFLLKRYVKNENIAKLVTEGRSL